MGQKVLVLGDSGTGKSASLRNFKPEEVLVINAAGKPLPFKNHFECITPSYNRLTDDVLQAMRNTKKKVIIIDDAQYIMSFQYMRRIKENGWDKWNDIQGDFFNIIKACDDLPADVVVYFLSHIQRDDEGREKIKTMGKMLDEKITIEGLFTTVLKTSVADGTYCFLTQNSGKDTVKSPIGMFDSYAIDNDLKYVDTKIRNYYEIGDYQPDEVVKELDQEAAKAEVVKPEADGRRRRRSAETPEAKMDRLQKEAEKAIADIDKGTGAIVGETHEEMKAEEALAEEPAKRRRKERNGEDQKEKHEEAPAKEKKEEATGGRRRRRKVTDDEGFMNLPDHVEDEGLPF